jgi:STE24 endopeptidase
VLKYNLLSAAIGCEESLHVNLFLFYIVYSPLNMLLSLLTNYLSRRHEYQADEFALTHGMAAQLSSALKKMSVNSLSNPNPHPAFVFFHYSHPTLLSRLEHLSGSQTDCR